MITTPHLSNVHEKSTSKSSLRYLNSIRETEKMKGSALVEYFSLETLPNSSWQHLSMVCVSTACLVLSFAHIAITLDGRRCSNL